MLTESSLKRWHYGWIVWIIGASFYFYEFLIQVSPGVMGADIMAQYHVNATSFGLLTTCYFIAYASMQIPAGLFFDRFGPRYLLTAAALCCAIGTLLFAFAPSFAWLQLARFLTGLGSAFALLGTLVLAANWFSPKRFAFLSGLIITVGMLGAMGGKKPLALLITQFGWRESMIILGVAGFVIAGILWAFIRDYNPELRNIQNRKHCTVNQLIKQLGQIVFTPQSWLVAIYGALMYGPTVALGTTWGELFLQTTHKFDNTMAAWINSLMFLGWAVGCPVSGAISDKMQLRKPVLYVASIGALLVSLVLFYIPFKTAFGMGLLLFIFGFFSSGFIPAFSIIRELHPVNSSGTALGFMNMFNSLGGAALPPIIGLILDVLWRHAHQGMAIANETARQYTSGQYHIAFSLLPLCFLVAIILIPVLKETHCHLQVND